jgi:hypothetical protein
MKIPPLANQLLITLLNALGVIVVGITFLFSCIALLGSVFDSAFSWGLLLTMTTMLATIISGIGVIRFSFLSQKHTSLKEAVISFAISFLPWLIYWALGTLFITFFSS